MGAREALLLGLLRELIVDPSAQSAPPQTCSVSGCRVADSSIERRFCFEVLLAGDEGLVLQAVSLHDFDYWIAHLTDGTRLPARQVTIRMSRHPRRPRRVVKAQSGTSASARRPRRARSDRRFLVIR